MPLKFAPTGGLAIGVPGEIAGLWKAHELGGKLPWKDLFQPTIRMCREGIPIHAALAKVIKSRAYYFSTHDNLR